MAFILCNFGTEPGVDEPILEVATGELKDGSVVYGFTEDAGAFRKKTTKADFKKREKDAAESVKLSLSYTHKVK